MSVQRKEAYLTLAKSLPSESAAEMGARNSMVKMVQAAFFPYKCSDLMSDKKDVAQWARWKMAGLVGEWRARLGAIKGIGAEQIAMEVKYLAEFFPQVTIAELKWAMDMYATGEIEIEWNAFSCQFMSNVIQEMQGVKQKQQAALVAMIPPKENKATPAEKCDAMKYMIAEVKKQIDDKRYQVIMIGDVFKYLRRTNKLNITQAMMEKGKKYAEEKIAAAKKPKAKASEFKTMKAMMESGFSGDNTGSLHRDFANEYCLLEYFRKHDMEKILASVNEKEF